MQTQRQQLNLFSSTPLSYDNMSKLKKCMEENYHYKVDQIDMKVNKDKGNGSIIVIRGYGANFIDTFVPSLSPIEKKDELTVSELEDELKDVIAHINGQLDHSMDVKLNIDTCSILREDLNYSALKQTCFSVYTGKDEFKVSFKWLKNSKTEGRKTDISLNNGDAYVIFMDESDQYTIGEASGDYLNKKGSVKKEKKASVKKEKKAKKAKNPLNDTKIYTSRELFVNGKSGDVVKGKNGSKLRVAIHKETREVLKKVEENWTDEGHAKFEELFPDGKAVSKKKAVKKKVVKKKVVKKKVVKKKVVKKKVEPIVEAKTVVEESNTTNVDKTVNDMPDELDDDLDLDDIESVTSETDNNEFDAIEETTLDGSLNGSDDEDHNEEEEEEEEEEEKLNDLNVDELQPDTYDDTDKVGVVPKSNECKLSMTTTLTIKLVLTTIPSTITLCDEYSNRKEERKVYLLLNKDIKELSIGKGHRIGNRIYGFETEYPVYNVIMM